MDDIKLTCESLEDYDKKRSKFFKFTKGLICNFFLNNLEQEPDYLHFKKNNIIVKKIKYQIAGYFNKKTNTWAWAWLKADLPKKRKKTAINILKYGIDIENEYIRRIFLEYTIPKLDKIYKKEMILAIISYFSKKTIVSDEELTGEKSNIEIYYFIELEESIDSLIEFKNKKLEEIELETKKNDV